MRIALLTGSRADKGGIEAVHNALGKDHNSYIVNAEEFSVYVPPDLAIVLGDRFEILRTAVELYIAMIPIAHLSGGDITEGSQDDSMRHAITKLSHLHFVTNAESMRRVIQMGEEPWRVHNVGYPGVTIKTHPFEDAKRLAGILSYPDDFLLVVWHPNTTVGEEEAINEVKVLTRALDKVFRKTIIIGPNADAWNEGIRKHLKHWAETTKNVYREELPRAVYLSLLANCGCLVGNSSSGYYEAPSFGKMAVNIGHRQTGRLRPHNIVQIPDIAVESIVGGIELALKLDASMYANPYGDGSAAKRIAEIISKIDDPKALLRKKWYDASGNPTYQRTGTAY